MYLNIRKLDDGIDDDMGRSTHFFGGGGASSSSTPTADAGYPRNGQASLPQSAAMRRGADDGGLVDFLGASGTADSAAAGGVRPSGGGGGRDGDRYGLFTSSAAGAGGGGSRVSRSRAQYDTLFGEEVRIEPEGLGNCTITLFS